MILKFCKRETELRLEIWTLEERRELVVSLITWGEQSFLAERILREIEECPFLAILWFITYFVKVLVYWLKRDNVHSALRQNT